jgi:hypothetical protein
MLIPMQLVLAVLPLVAAAATALPDGDRAGLLRQIAGVPMAWRIERVADPASGDKSCVVISMGGDLRARLFKERRAKAAAWSLRVGFANHPGSLRYLRIGKRYFQSAEESFRGAEAEEIVERLKSPGEFVFEWAQRPGHAKRGGLYGTGDFAAKAAACEAWMRGTRV